MCSRTCLSTKTTYNSCKLASISVLLGTKTVLYNTIIQTCEDEARAHACNNGRVVPKLTAMLTHAAIRLSGLLTPARRNESLFSPKLHTPHMDAKTEGGGWLCAWIREVRVPFRN